MDPGTIITRGNDGTPAARASARTKPPPYYENPLPGVPYFALDLGGRGAARA